MPGGFFEVGAAVNFWGDKAAESSSVIAGGNWSDAKAPDKNYRHLSHVCLSTWRRRSSFLLSTGGY